MIKTIQILMLLLLAFNLKAQSHISKGDYRCLLVAHSGNGLGGISCPACAKKEKEDRDAKATEDKRREIAHSEKIKADRLATENLRLEKLRLQKEEEKRKKDKEIADKIAHDNAMRKYKQIAAAGIVKSNTKGSSPEINLSNIECFKDDKRKIYGFQINKEEVLTFPYDREAMNIKKIEGSNLFAVDVWETPNKYSYSYLIDYTGKKIKVDGIDKSNYRIWSDPQNKIIFFYKKISTEETDKGALRTNPGLGNFHNSKESALADVQSHHKAGWGMHGDETVCYDTRYSLDFNGNLLEKLNGYTIRIID
jgi:hypothetical protein